MDNVRIECNEIAASEGMEKALKYEILPGKGFIDYGEVDLCGKSVVDYLDYNM